MLWGDLGQAGKYLCLQIRDLRHSLNDEVDCGETLQRQTCRNKPTSFISCLSSEALLCYILFEKLIYYPMPCQIIPGD